MSQPIRIYSHTLHFRFNATSNARAQDAQEYAMRFLHASWCHLGPDGQAGDEVVKFTTLKPLPDVAQSFLYNEFKYCARQSTFNREEDPRKGQ